MLRKYHLALKQGAPMLIVEDENLIKRWKDERKGGKEYFDTRSGSIVLNSILCIVDVTKDEQLKLKLGSGSKEIIDTPGGLSLPAGVKAGLETTN